MKEYNLPNTTYKLRYHDLPGDNTPILFIHGLGCAGSFDYPQVAAQPALRNHRCILVDLLGAGFSDKPEDFSYTVDAHADQVLALVKHLKLERFILFGHSLGGAVALVLADKCRDRVSSLILSEANLDPSGEGTASKRIAGYEMTEFIEQGYHKLVSNSRTVENGLWSASLSVWSAKAAYLLSQCAASVQQPSWREILYSLDCPKTYIFGRYSLPSPDLAVLEQQGVNVEIVEQAGHSMAWENPEGLANAIGKHTGS